MAVNTAHAKLIDPVARTDTAVSRAADFDPATSTAVFRIGLSDEVEFALLPSLLKRLRSEAPGIVLVVRRTNYILMPALLSSGEISIGVSYTDDLPANADAPRRPG